MIGIFQIFEYILFLNETSQLVFLKDRKASGLQNENTLGTSGAKLLLPTRLSITIKQCWEISVWMFLEIFKMPRHRLPSVDSSQSPFVPIQLYIRRHPTHFGFKEKDENLDIELFSQSSVRLTLSFVKLLAKFIQKDCPQTKEILEKENFPVNRYQEIKVEYQKFVIDRKILCFSLTQQKQNEKEEPKKLKSIETRSKLDLEESKRNWTGSRMYQVVPRYLKILFLLDLVYSSSFSFSFLSPTKEKEMQILEKDKKKRSFFCAFCLKPNCVLVCSKCKQDHYCSPICQKKDFPFHSFARCKRGTIRKEEEKLTTPKETKESDKISLKGISGIFQTATSNKISLFSKDDPCEPSFNYNYNDNPKEKEKKEENIELNLLKQCQKDPIYNNLFKSVQQNVKEDKDLSCLTTEIFAYFRNTLRKHQDLQVELSSKINEKKRSLIQKAIFNQKLAQNFLDLLIFLVHGSKELPSLELHNAISGLSFHEKLTIAYLCEFQFSLKMKPLKVANKKKKTKKNQGKKKEMTK